MSILIIYLSTVGIETTKFNKQIDLKIKDFNKDLKLELKEVKIILDPFKFKINAKTVSKLAFSNLKKCGLSKQKVKGIKDLAKKTLNKTFKPNLIKKNDR